MRASSWQRLKSFDLKQKMKKKEEEKNNEGLKALPQEFESLNDPIPSHQATSLADCFMRLRLEGLQVFCNLRSMPKGLTFWTGAPVLKRCCGCCISRWSFYELILGQESLLRGLPILNLRLHHCNLPLAAAEILPQLDFLRHSLSLHFCLSLSWQTAYSAELGLFQKDSMAHNLPLSALLRPSLSCRIDRLKAQCNFKNTSHE